VHKRRKIAKANKREGSDKMNGRCIVERQVE